MRVPGAALKHYVRVIGGSTPAPDETNWDGGVNWLTPTDVSLSHGGEVMTSARTLSAQGLALCAATLAPAGSVVVTTRAPIGNVAITRVPSATNQGCRTLLPDRRLDARYLRYQLQTRTEELQSHGAGSTFLELSGPALGATEIRVPMFDRQRTIADFLDRECGRLEDVRTAWCAQHDAFDELRVSATREAARGLRQVRLKQAASVLDCKHRTPEYTNSGFPVISTREVTRGELVIDDTTRRVSVDDFDDLRNGERDPRPGDLIYSRNASVGVAATVPAGPAVCMGQDVVLITRRPRDSELLALILNWAVADQVEQLSVGSTFSRINVPTIRELVVPDDTPEREHAVLRAP